MITEELLTWINESEKEMARLEYLESLPLWEEALYDYRIKNGI